MAGKTDARLAELGIDLPEPRAPRGNYVGYVVTGSLVYIAGQVSAIDGDREFIGKVGRDFTVEEGQQAARLCAINILSQVRAACAGELDRVRRCVKLGGFVNSTDDFADQPKVLNGASDFIAEVLGERGPHARFAVSTPGLPLGAAVEVDAIFEIS